MHHNHWFGQVIKGEALNAWPASGSWWANNVEIKSDTVYLGDPDLIN